MPAHRSVARHRRPGRPRGRRRARPSRSPTSSPSAARTACRDSSCSPPGTPRAAPRARAAARTGAPGARVRHADHRPERLRGHQHLPRGPAQRLARPRDARAPAGSACSPSPAPSASPCSPGCTARRGAPGPSPPSSPRATARTSPATTSCSTGTTTRTPTSSCMYLESIGNPRKFTRLARRTAAAKPVVVVAGRAAQRRPHRATPSARPACPHATVSALLRQAGVIRVDTVTELVDAGPAARLPAAARRARASRSSATPSPSACSPTTRASPRGCGRCRRWTSPRRPPRRTSDAPWRARAGRRRVRRGGRDRPSRRSASGVRRRRRARRGAQVRGGRRPRQAGRRGPCRARRPRGGPVRGGQHRAGQAAAGRGRRSAPTTPAAPWTGCAPHRPPRNRRGRRDAASAASPPTPPPSAPCGPSPRPCSTPSGAGEAAEPGKVPESSTRHRRGGRRRPDRRRCGSTPRRSGPHPRQRRETCELLGPYGIGVHRALPAPDPDARRRGPPPRSATRSRSRPPPRTCATAPTSAASASTSPTRTQLRRAYAELTELLGGPDELRPVVQAMAPRGVDTVVRAVIDPAAGAVLSFGLAGAASRAARRHRAPAGSGHRPGRGELIRSIRTAPLLFGWRGSDARSTPRRWRNSCCGCPGWSTTIPRSSRSPWSRSSSPRTV